MSGVSHWLRSFALFGALAAAAPPPEPPAPPQAPPVADLPPQPNTEGSYEQWEDGLQTRVNAQIDALLDAAARGDQARFDALLVPAGVVPGYPSLQEGRTINHGGAPLLTMATIGKFARECRRSAEQGEFLPHEPPRGMVYYDCDGIAGFLLYAIWDEAGERIETLALSGPE